RVRISVTTEKDPNALWPLPPEILQLLAIPPRHRTKTEQQQLLAHYRGASPTVRQIEGELFRLSQRETELASAKYSTLVMQERPVPRQTFIQVRGNFLDKGHEVRP